MLTELCNIDQIFINFSDAERNIGYQTKDMYILTLGNYILILNKEFEDEKTQLQGIQATH